MVDSFRGSSGTIANRLRIPNGWNFGGEHPALGTRTGGTEAPNDR